ncbi:MULTISPECIES: DNA repair protein RecN [unclassified Paenibacillus]|uniref:DNA repair protein RecN n=1 Tax=unclassified Paenibacillus TaxID=185978 RepID=UPI001AE47F4F|nr:MULTISPECIES: DNA repair protein RecN [unclassified Paenibacillus]MBP1155147.1 DNA repair protein RecN (Recombination protein N) [Paenibacillus sp. PvP091]MBP1169469.1 DNA repair protein RecN (Recombination protein N) [Paenibacillus sp. PvR098]MBP2440497.1 DNA repair protein RecN (Recombination protein N) [Paenibacillus sp. PvP052]
MLLEMSIRQLAVIEHVELHCKSGFHVLTGETGAGKSIIIDALSLIAGGRSSSDLVRYGSNKASIEAMFGIGADHPVWSVLDRLGIEGSPEEHLIIRREITAQGKSTSRINGQLVNRAMLKEVGEWLVNIHGQHEHQSLFKVEEHLRWLDLFGEAEITPAKRAYQEAYDAYQTIRKQVRELQDTSKQNLQMIDLYRFQVEEIHSAQLKPGEDEALAEEKQKLGNAEKLYSSAADAYDQLYDGNKGLDAVRRAMQKLQDIAVLDPSKLQALTEQVQSAYYQLEDATYQIRDYRDEIEFNPSRLDFIEQRMDTISSLRRKYGDTVSDILAYGEKIEQELDMIENKDEKLLQLEKQEQVALAALQRIADDLTGLRKSVADRLAAEIVAELRDLHMERTQFQVNFVSTDGRKLTRDGADQVEFLISANPGEPLRSLSKIASGGEISRVMLALKSIFARVDQIPVLVFDEVDTGVSGRAAQAIAEKMSRLSLSCQVFSITHLPQVACMADAHYRIHKTTDGDRTYTNIDDLSTDERVHELARMLGGVEVTEKTLQHAQEMLMMANDKKARMD